MMPSQLITERGSDLIILNPGSTYMRIGLASSPAPVVVPHFVAWRNNDPGGTIDDLTNDFKGAIGEEKFITCALSETRRKEREEVLQMLETEVGLGMVGKEQLGIGHRKTENLENLPTTMLPDVNGEAFSWTSVATKNNCVSSFESNACDKTVDGTSFGTETDGSKEGPVTNQNQVPNSSHGGHPLHKFICGDEALKIPFGEPYSLRRPICRGHLNISDSYSLQQVCDDLYTIWDWALTKKLDIAVKHRKHYSVVLVVPETLDSREVKEMLTILLRDLGLHSAVIHQESVATTFGNGVSSACVVNLGAQVTSIICVEDGVALPTTKVILPFGGEDISRCLLWVQRCMRNWPPVDCDPLHNPLDLLMLDKVKEGHCCIKEGEQRAFIEVKFHSRGKPTQAFKVTMSALNIPPMGIFYPALLAPEEYVPCSRPWYHNEVEDLMFDEAIHLDTGRRNESVDAGPFMPNQNLYMPVGCSEINPRYSDQIRNKNGEPLVGLAQAVVHSILSTGRMDLQKKLFSGIQMAGGVAITPGLIDAVEERVLQAIPEHESIDTVEVLQPRSDPSTVAWKGGMVLGILDTARDTWIQQEDWIDGGLRVGTSRKYKDSFFLQTHIFWYTSS